MRRRRTDQNRTAKIIDLGIERIQKEDKQSTGFEKQDTSYLAKRITTSTEFKKHFIERIYIYNGKKYKNRERRVR